jgi:hypothetical protein
MRYLRMKEQYEYDLQEVEQKVPEPYHPYIKKKSNTEYQLYQRAKTNPPDPTNVSVLWMTGTYPSFAEAKHRFDSYENIRSDDDKTNLDIPVVLNINIPGFVKLIKNI